MYYYETETSVLDSDWLSRVRCITRLFTLCVARQPLCSTTVSEELHCLVEEYCFY